MKKYLYADLYELEEKHWWHIAKRETCLLLIKKFLKIKNPKILDIGCGTGKNIEEFSKLGQAYGIDNSTDAIKFCTENRSLKNVQLGDAEKTGFKKCGVDLVTLLDVLEHTDDVKTLKEAHRILKNRGLLLLTIPAYQWMWSNWDVVLDHRRRYTKRQIEELLKNHGFEVVKCTYLYSFLLLPVFIVRKIKNIFFKKTYPSDFKVGLPLVDKVMGHISAFEKEIALKSGIPFGLSIVALARKN